MIKYPILVKRKLSTGRLIEVRKLAENKNGTYFQYEKSYLEHHSKSISPYKIDNNLNVQKAEVHPHGNLHGVFADSLPDSWGRYLIARKCQKLKKNPHSLSPLERLLLIGAHGTGALIYETDKHSNENLIVDLPLSTLEHAAISEFEQVDTEYIDSLINSGGAGGSRPKLNLIRKPDNTYSMNPLSEGVPVIIKLASQKLPLGETEPLVEYLYMNMAKKAGITVPSHNLIISDDEKKYWLELERFDCSVDKGRFHLISACGLLDAPSNMPSLDYLDLIKITHSLCGPADAKNMFKRAMFNYLTCNQDDHSKNFSFIADDNDQWQLAPMYDTTFSPNYLGCHATSFMGYGSIIPKKALDELSRQAGLSGISAGMRVAEEVYEVVSKFYLFSEEIFLDEKLTRTIQNTINKKWRALSSK